jgi:Zn-dependent protease
VINDPAEERGPLTPFERGFYVLLFTVILGLFAAEIADDFQPRKLAVPFFLLSWPVLLVIHESGHALAAGFFGWRVRLIVIGAGRLFGRMRVGGVPVEFRAIPLSGYVQPVPRDLRFPRLKMALIYLAGPGIEILLVLALGAYLGPGYFLRTSDEIPVIALQAFAVCALFGACMNLIPVPFQQGSASAVSDGLSFFRSWTMPDEEFEALMRAPPVEYDEPADDAAYWEDDRRR